MLRGSAVLLSGGVAGAAATYRMSTDAAAAEADLDVAGDSVEVTYGEVAAVWLDLVLGWAYAVPSEESPDTLELEVLAGTDADDLQSVATTSSDEPFLEADGEETFEMDLLAEDAVDAAELMPEAGETEETTVHVAAEMRLLDHDGFVIAADGQTDTATISIEKTEYDPDEHGAIAGVGELAVEVE